VFGREKMPVTAAIEEWLALGDRLYAKDVDVSAGGDPDLAPGPMDIEEDEQIGGSVALVLAIVALKLTRLGRDRRPHLADELDRALVEADHWAVRIRRFGIEVEHVDQTYLAASNCWLIPNNCRSYFDRSFNRSKSPCRATSRK
jgi:hypothetical protein